MCVCERKEGAERWSCIFLKRSLYLLKIDVEIFTVEITGTCFKRIWDCGQGNVRRIAEGTQSAVS